MVPSQFTPLLHRIGYVALLVLAGRVSDSFRILNTPDEPAATNRPAD